MLDVFTFDLEIASRDVNEAKIVYSYCRYLVEQAWKKHNLFVDQDPRLFNPKCPPERVDVYRDKLSTLALAAKSREMDAREAYQKLDAAKAILLSLLED